MLNLKTKIILDGLGAKLNPDEISQSDAIEKIQRLAEKLGLPLRSLWPSNEHKNPTIDLLMTVASMFGLDEGNDKLRYLQVLQEIVPLILALGPGDIRLSEIRYALTENLYEAFTASGKHRFYPLAGVLHNIFLGQNIYEPVSAADNPHFQEVVKYLDEDSPASVIQDLPRRSLTIDLPSAIRQRIQQNEAGWLDIGSAFKTEGAPTLNVLHKLFPGLELYGDDISFPLFRIDNGRIEHSSYINEEALSRIKASGYISEESPFKRTGIVAGARYFNGCYPEHSVFDDRFFPNQRFDFISLCMTFHHLHIETDKAQYIERLLTDKMLVDENGQELTVAQKTIRLYPSQQKVFERLLDHLEIGGLFFFNIFVLGDTFYIFQRLDENKYKIYTQHPVLFTPDDDVYSPSEYFGLIKGNKSNTFAKLAHEGLQKILNLTDAEADELQKWFTQADKLNAYYQQWPECFTASGANNFQPWPRVEAAMKLLVESAGQAEKLNLPKLFEDYLIESVPEKLKTDLLNTEIIQLILGKP
jgi:hypothetical protein